MSVMINALSVDVEDYFQVSAFEAYIRPDQWPEYECRIVANTNRILNLFSEADATATFFFLGWIAERYPELVERAVAEGHEIASHGYSHVRVTEQSEQEFEADVVRTREILESISGCAVAGYRAASYSIAPDNSWAHDVLARTGHRYSSSFYPIHHDRYGMPDGNRFPHPVGSSMLPEIPVATVQLGRMRVPCGGGGYFRLLPYSWTRWCLRQLNSRDQVPAVFYFHPWEIDPGQPRVADLDARTRFRHYVNLRGFESKLRRLLVDFSWRPISEVFAGTIEQTQRYGTTDRESPEWPGR